MTPPKCRLCGKEHWMRDGCNFGKPNWPASGFGLARIKAQPKPKSAAKKKKTKAKGKKK